MGENENKDKVPEEKEKKKSEGTPEENAEEAPAETEPEAEPKEAPETEPAEPEKAPDTSELDSIKAENLRLKTQIEAYKAGFKADVLEDAVLLAAAVSERDGIEISAALKAVGEKYPDWKTEADNPLKSGFRIGADSPEEKKPDDERLANAFGIRKKG